MLFALFSLGSTISGSRSVTGLTLEVRNSTHGILQKKLSLNASPFSFELDENHTLSLTVASTFTSAPKHHVVALESGPYSVSTVLNFKGGALSIALTSAKLRKLYKHSGKYNLRLAIADPLLEAPILWHVAVVDYIALGEVVDNFTDVEWDFTPPPKTPNPLLTTIFTYLMFVPLVVLLGLLLANGVNCGYFPRSFFDAIVSLAFVAGLGAFFAFFVYFWRYVTFEEMFKYLLGIVPLLGILLRGALGGRAKMAARYRRND
jgi:hypothetical protein